MAKKVKSQKLLSLWEIDKKYGTISQGSAILVENDRTLRIPSRCPWLTYQTGGGLAYGKINEVFGYESTGKSLMAKDFGIVAQKMGGVVIYADPEQALDLAWAEKVGLDISKMYVYDETNAIEPISDWFRDLMIALRAELVNNEPILLVIDSIAALDTQSNIGIDMTDRKAQMGNRAKAIGDMWRTRQTAFKKYGITVLAVNQVRKKLGASMFESNETQPGGEATKFYASVRLSLNRGKQIKGKKKNGVFQESADGRKIGQNIYVRVEKNKTAPPRGSIKTQVYFLDDMYGYVGYSKYEGLQDILIEQKVLKKKGNAYFFKSKGKLIKVAGKYDDITKNLEENEVLRRKILRRSGIPTISTAIEKLESIKKNLYPVNLGKSRKE